MNNSKYYKILKETKAEIEKKGISDKVIENLKMLRVMVIDENKPLLAKALRLTYQHIEKNKTFNVAIPEDEPIEGVKSSIIKSKINPTESLTYLLSNMEDISNKINIADIREFVNSMKEQAGEDW